MRWQSHRFRIQAATAAAITLLIACSNPQPHEPRDVPPARDITDLHFVDPQLDAIAKHLVQRARSRGIDTSAGHNRTERLLSLEASLGGSERALQRVNELTQRMTATDVSQWGMLRQRAERDFRGREGEAAARVRDLLARWQRRKAEIVLGYLSSNYTTAYLPSMEWERRFHQFVRQQPRDAATWGWLVLREYTPDAQQQYGRADAESAYRFYVVFSGLSDGREARRIFSVPRIEIEEPVEVVKAPPRPSRLWRAP